MALPANLKLTRDGLDRMRRDLQELAESSVLVGFPQETSDRDPEPGEDSLGITNAALGYIHNTGMPEQNIPQREFMESGMASVRDPATAALTSIARDVVVKGDPDAASKGLHRVGLIVSTGIKRKLNEGIPPPLAESTLRERAKRGRKGAKKELQRRSDGESPSTQFAKPLIDTAQLRNAINYVILSNGNRTLGGSEDA